MAVASASECLLTDWMFLSEWGNFHWEQVKAMSQIERTNSFKAPVDSKGALNYALLQYLNSYLDESWPGLKNGFLDIKSPDFHWTRAFLLLESIRVFCFSLKLKHGFHLSGPLSVLSAETRVHIKLLLPSRTLSHQVLAQETPSYVIRQLCNISHEPL